MNTVPHGALGRTLPASQRTAKEMRSEPRACEAERATSGAAPRGAVITDARLTTRAHEQALDCIVSVKGVFEVLGCQVEQVAQ